MTIVEYERKFFELVPYAGVSDSSPLMVQHFIRGLNDSIIGGVKVFQPKTLKDVVLRATLVEASVFSGQGGVPGVQAGGSSYSIPSRGNQLQRALSSKNPPNFSKGNQEQ